MDFKLGLHDLFCSTPRKRFHWVAMGLADPVTKRNTS